MCPIFDASSSTHTIEMLYTPNTEQLSHVHFQQPAACQHSIQSAAWPEQPLRQCSQKLLSAYNSSGNTTLHQFSKCTHHLVGEPHHTIACSEQADACTNRCCLPIQLTSQLIRSSAATAVNLYLDTKRYTARSFLTFPLLTSPLRMDVRSALVPRNLPLVRSMVNSRSDARPA